MKRRIVSRWGIPALILAGLGMGLVNAPVEAQTSATPTAGSCGAPIFAWQPATADDVSVALLTIEQVLLPPPLSPVASPVADESANFYVELELENVGQDAADVVTGEIALLLCDGERLNPVPDELHPALEEGELAAGESATGWVAFALPAEAVPVRLVVPVARPGLSGGRVEFPLADPNVDPESGETTDVAGGDSFGGDAVGGDGAAGADATPAGGS